MIKSSQFHFRIVLIKIFNVKVEFGARLYLIYQFLFFTFFFKQFNVHMYTVSPDLILNYISIEFPELKSFYSLYVWFFLLLLDRDLYIVCFICSRIALQI